MEPGHPHPSLLVSILLAAFIIWRFYARIRRMVVRQKLSKVRPWITVCVFPIVLVLFAVLSISHGVDLASLFGGAVVGIGLCDQTLEVLVREYLPPLPDVRLCCLLCDLLD